MAGGCAVPFRLDFKKLGLPGISSPHGAEEGGDMVFRLGLILGFHITVFLSAAFNCSKIFFLQCNLAKEKFKLL